MTCVCLSQVSQFLRRELPVRLAHRARDLSGMEGLSETDGIRKVTNWYEESFRDIVQVAPLLWRISYYPLNLNQEYCNHR